ncbi:3-hydroxyacyl-CoA dehydrogenase /Enoyl-CoA hydratase [Archaeoglobus sulfaticallidus PM70-1]|uniref:3-hydroxyacyl-CoA dehydrogenase /Enoyl-CoA hydratase n=1 Tax=Archaeoglobus sulfaticallidus PM70-1 TaxID=387631 RepID=N0B980_9EURY|nr:3-hydroxyacyl-CoA dehydrogenase/enoyl-CoA hydratase family protein [Archaeoglobus sulfaticallidus]AGK60174.1 3-hydroxyacyl-CoA dehydrogenase /Enoyl-CoA hydratase [Archaeoglobus sulfaticallidus PM70-1]
MKNVLVIGAGTMGHGIAEVCAIAGYNVTIVDIKDEFLEKAVKKIGWSLKKLESKKKIKENAEDVLKRIKTTTNLEEAAKEADFVIEAVIEDTDVKKDIFKRLDENCKEGVIFSTNTSTIPITDISSATRRPESVIGLHFFNPPTLIKLVEIIRGERTSDETVEKTKEFAKTIGMDYVLVEKDVPGFLVNRINLRVFTEAIRMVEEGFKPEEIDSAVKYRLGLPMGILEVVDFSGVDIVFYVTHEMMKRGVNVKPSKLVEEMIKEGRLGMKSGRGFYEHKGVYHRVKIPRNLAYRVNPVRILAPAINEASWLLRNGIATREDIDKAMVLGMGYPKGLLEMADDFGIDMVVETLEARAKETGLDEYSPDPLLVEMVEAKKLGKKSGEGFYTWNYEQVDFGPVRYEKRHNYALITMRRPDKLNSLNEEMWTGLNQAFKKAEEDKDVRAVLITGEGKAFCAGDDISVMGSWKKFTDGRDFFEKVALPLVATLMEYTKPTISLVNGYAFGGGMELNLLFDIVIASEKASFAVPEGLIGAMPPIASTIGVAMLGRKFIKYCLTGDQLDPEEAEELGFVDVVVPHDQLEMAGIEYVEKVSRLAPLSVKAIKESVNAVRKTFTEALELSKREIVMLIPTSDFAEGMMAFVKKKRPVWKGY